MPIRKDKLIKREDINENIVLIEGSDTDYITKNARVYKKYGDDLYYEKKPYLNKRNGYCYVGITMIDGKNKNYRLHRLVAKAFIPNLEGFEVVGHKNNIKHDNRVENLYWTTIQENTQKAFDDGLIVNAKGFDDSQSIPVNVYKNGNFICTYGSIKECSRETGIPANTIIRRANNEIKTNYRKYKEFDFKY